MKISSKLFICALLVLLSGCDARVRFESPQPEGGNDFQFIPEKLHGTYWSGSDSTFLLIDSQQIIEKTEIPFKVHKHEVDSTEGFAIEDDQLVDIDRGLKIDIEFEGDSITGSLIWEDTLFTFSKQHKLRGFKGHFFINRSKGDYWIVEKMTLQRGGRLSLSGISPEDMDKIKEITEVVEVESRSGKVVAYRLQPSRRELRKIVKRSFSKHKEYQRIDPTFPQYKEVNGVPRFEIDTLFRIFKSNQYSALHIVGLPTLFWEDIPQLLAYGDDETLLTDFPRNFISSYRQENCYTGILALWLIESIRIAERREITSPLQRFPSQNPILQPIGRERLRKKPNTQEEMDLFYRAYRRWWKEVKHMDKKEASQIDPLEGAGFEW